MPNGEGWTFIGSSNQDKMIDSNIELGKRYYYFVTWSLDVNGAPYYQSNLSHSSYAECHEWDAIHEDATAKNLALNSDVNQLSISWERRFSSPDYDPSLAIQNFILYRYENQTCDLDNTSSCAGLTTVNIDESSLCTDISSSIRQCSYTDTSTKNYKKYYYQIKSNNAYVSVYSNQVSGYSTDLPIPNLVNLAPPTLINLNQQTTIRFTNTGGGQLLSCDVNPGLPTGLSIGITADNDSCQITGTPTQISSKKTYYLAARNASGISNSSLTLSVTSLNAPVITQAAPLDKKVTLSWGDVSDADNYRVFWREGVEVTTEEFSSYTNTSVNSLTIANLSNDLDYYFAIQAQNNHQTSALSNNVKVTPSGLIWENHSYWSRRRAHSSVSFNNKMWVIGGDDGIRNIWSSSDGVAWKKERDSLPWDDCCSDAFVFNNQLWYIESGWYRSSSSQKKNKIWSSTDGVEWTNELEAPWTGRQDFSITIFNNKIWMLGGDNDDIYENDVWSSEDGINWTKVANAPWSARARHTSFALDNKIWVIGGWAGYDNFNNEIWYSSDGANWTQHSSNGPWTLSARFESVVFNDKVWLFGGYNYRNNTYAGIWSSSDGENWQSVNNFLENRTGMSSVVFQDKLWVMGGYQRLEQSNSSVNLYYSDVWQSSDGASWTKVLDKFKFAHYRTGIEFQNKLWMFGENDIGFYRLGDIWNSTNGNTWSYAGEANWESRKLCS